MSKNQDLISRHTNPVICVLSWLGVISLILVGKDNRIIYLFIALTILMSLLINSLIFKIFKVRSLSYDFIVYHYIMSLSITISTFLSTLCLVHYHRVFRSITKLFILVPGTCGTCPFKTEVIEDVPIRIYTPLEVKSDVVIVYFHGGLFCYYNLNVYHRLMCLITSRVGCKVVLCGHKLAPEFPFPNSTIETYEVLNWVQSNSDKLNINKRRVVVMGDGSGAALAAGAALIHKHRQGQSLIREHSDLQPPIAAQILVSPILQGYSYGPDRTMNDGNAVSAEHKSLFLSYYLAGNCTFSASLGKEEGDTSEFPHFWKVCIDDAVKVRDPVTELKPSLSGIWNEYAFPLMSSDPSSLPNTLIVGHVGSENFDDARYYNEWLVHHNVPVKFIRDYNGYQGNIMVPSISGSAQQTIQHVSDYINQILC